MASVKQFEELRAWQKARQLTRAIYKVTSDGPFARDFGLRDQVRRAAVSTMSNIAEGFERGGDREFRQFLALAKGSAGEVRSQLYVALDTNLLRQDEFEVLAQLVTELSALIAGLMRYLGASEYKGNKFKELDGPTYEVVYDEDAF